MNSKKIKLYSLLAFMFASTLVLSGCGEQAAQKTSEKTAEKIIEKQIGGNADVDIDENNIKMETDQGSMEVGENVKLPADFPSDVYVVDGKLLSVFSDKTNNSHMVTLETEKSMEDASSVYQIELAAKGWEITGTIAIGDSTSIIAEKDTRTASVSISKGDKATTVILSTENK